MHRSRINGIPIDCNVDDVDAAARFRAEALPRRARAAWRVAEQCADLGI